MRSESEILRKIDSFAPGEGEWRPLDDLFAELWALGVKPAHLPVLFRVFERFPDDDGAGVLWSIVHGVEALPFGYELPLIESIRRQPSLLGEIMLKRLRKSRVIT